VPAGHRPTFIEFDVPRVFCPYCKVIRQTKVNFVEPNKHYTKKLKKCILEDSKIMTTKDLAKRYHIGYHVCYDTIIDDLKKRFSKIDLRNVTTICIDEILFKHNHNYITIVLNLITKRIIYVGEGKGTAALDDFYKLLGPRRCKKITGVSIDMSTAYILSVKQNLVNAEIIFDHFHVVKLFNIKLSQLRTELARYLSGAQKKVLKGIRWILLKNPENLSTARNEAQRLEEALKDNKDLALGYYLKESLRQIWRQDTIEQATAHINQWIESAKASNVHQIQVMGETLEKYSYGIINWYKNKINSGTLEGVNNKIKVLMRKSYGIKNFEHLKLHLYALHETSQILTRS
jgi:transposase